MARHKKTQQIIDEATKALKECRPMTVRQVYYRLVATHVIANTKSQYKAVCNALRDARKERLIPWAWIEDRLRRPRQVSMWRDVADFAETARRAYRRDAWATQKHYVECWLEKDALSGIFEDILDNYGVTLNVGRGYDGWSSIRGAAQRYDNAVRYGPASKATILYFGDFDPSGLDMVRSLEERLRFFLWACPEIRICAILREDIGEYDLPPDFTKSTDSRQAAFVREHGDIAVELDALPLEVLQGRIRDEVEGCMDIDALEATQEQEEEDRERIGKLLGGETDAEAAGA